MSFMTEKVFIDTNILVYAFLENDTVRHDMAMKLMSDIKRNIRIRTGTV